MSNAPTLVRQDQAPYNTDAEILAALLGTTTERADRILERTTLEQLQLISPEEIIYAAAVTGKQARTLAAATAFAKRLRQSAANTTPSEITCPEDVVNLLQLAHDDRTQEELHVLLISTRGMVISHHMPYRGNVNSSVVRPAEVLRPAVLAGAPSIIISHNHPGGDPNPSSADVLITNDIHRAAVLMGITLLDHIVTAPDRRFVSMKEKKMLADEAHLHRH